MKLKTLELFRQENAVGNKFYIPLITPIRQNLEEHFKTLPNEMIEAWTLPQGATTVIDGNGAEHIFFMGEECHLVTDTLTSTPMLVGKDIWEPLTINVHYDEKQKCYAFPGVKIA